MRFTLTCVAACALGLLSSQCSKSSPAPARKAAPVATASALVQAAVEQQPKLAASWPESSTLLTVSAEQLRAQIRARGKKGTLVNAWASWCGPCRAELPMLTSLAKNLAPQSIEVVLVSVDEPADRPKAEEFLRSYDVRLPAYIAEQPLGAFKLDMNPRWPGMLPATFLFDGDARLRYFWGGQAFENELVGVIDGFLAGKPIDGEANFALAPGATTP
ncbi:MAG: TlpA disulfide reductase family protein [Polyangiaceae bacterium]